MKIINLLFFVMISVFLYSFQDNQTQSVKTSDIPKEVYGDKNTSKKLKLSNGGAGPTGILKELANDYLSIHKDANIAIEWYQNISLNSLNLLKEKKVDIALIYEPIEAKKAMDEGLVSNLSTIFNDHFIIVGPKNNFVKLNKHDSPANSFAKIYNYSEKNPGKKVFLSRNDFSGTNEKERLLWKLIHKEPYSENLEWYFKFSVFPEDALLKADSENIYTITDWGTWLKASHKLKNLIVYIKGGYELLNPCVALLQQNPSTESIEFLKYLKSDRAQKIIKNFGKDKYNGSAFFTEANQIDF